MTCLRRRRWWLVVGGCCDGDGGEKRGLGSGNWVLGRLPAGVLLCMIRHSGERHF